MVVLCEYSDVFGQPGRGAHSIRLAGVAVVDVGLTVLAAWLVARYADLPFGPTLAACFGLGILAHRLFCVRTAIDRALFSI